MALEAHSHPPAPQARCSIRVRYAETDQMGVVYHSHYLIWFEVGRTEFCRQRGFAYRDMEREDGLCIIVAEVRCRYHAPARYDDEIEILTRLVSMRRRVITFRYEVRRAADSELLAEGETVHVITDLSGRPRALPEKYRKLLAEGMPPADPNL
jgi:acyl-CoA thioester hydrolase